MTLQYVHEEPPQSYYFDLSDAAQGHLDDDQEGYPHGINIAAQMQEKEQEEEPILEFINLDIVKPTTSMIETQVHAISTWHRIIHQDIDPMHLRPYLGWRSLEVVKKTLKNTTQMAHMIIRYPLRRHVKSKFPHMNVTRIDETVSTDPLFANCK